VPDFYQGTELWDLSFVDPDNRRPVDFAKRTGWLEELKQREKKDRASLISELVQHWSDGRIKLYTIYKGLNFRRAENDLFDTGDYIPLQTSGKVKDNVCAFARRKDGAWALTAAPRLMTRLTEAGAAPLGERAWGKSVLTLPGDAPDRWMNIFTGEELKISPVGDGKQLRVADVFQAFPVAMLASV
jgi:(1->4)-alpha-D-glucan 1-alpha-D-glucosylmutase